MQTQLLRVVQEHTFKRVGSNDWKRSNFRLVCATNRDLQEDLARGRFRTDLYYRIAGVCCHVPPLRERVADIPALVRHFISELAGDRIVPGIDEPVLQWLTSREYRGNIRELRLVVARMLYRHTGPGPLSIGDIPEEDRCYVPEHTVDWRDQSFQNAIARAIACGVGLKEIGRGAENIAEQIVLEQENGSIHPAAVRLGVSDRALQLRRAARRSHPVTSHFRQSNGESQGTDSPDAA